MVATLNDSHNDDMYEICIIVRGDSLVVAQFEYELNKFATEFAAKQPRPGDFDTIALVNVTDEQKRVEF